MIRELKTFHKSYQLASFINGVFANPTLLAPVINTSDVDSLVFAIVPYNITSGVFRISDILQSDSPTMDDATPVPANKFVDSQGRNGQVAKDLLKVSNVSDKIGFASVVDTKQYLQVYVESELGGSAQIFANINILQKLKINAKNGYL